MTMEKYGVSDRVELQRKELAQVRARLTELRNSNEKTASATEELTKLQNRETDLIVSLAEQ